MVISDYYITRNKLVTFNCTQILEIAYYCKVAIISYVCVNTVLKLYDLQDIEGLLY